MLFVPSQVVLAANTFTGDQTVAANLLFSGSARRVKGDFTNATRSSRTLFQTTTVNGATTLGCIPDGTGTVGAFNLFGGSDPDNTSILFFQMAEGATQQAILGSSSVGTGTTRGMFFSMGGTNRWSIDTSGNLVALLTGQFFQADFSNATQANRFLFQSSTSNGNTFVGLVPNGSAVSAGLNVFGTASPTNSPIGQFLNDGTNVILRSTATGSGTAGTIQFQAKGTTTYLTLDTSLLTFADATNVAVNTSTGTKIGTATGQKLGFWNATPVIQQASANQAALTDSTGGATSTTLSAITAGAAYSQTDMTNAKNAIASLALLLNAIRTALVNTGIIKGSA